MKILSKQILLPIGVLSGLALFIVLFLYFFPKSSIQGVSALLIENPAAIPNPKQANSRLSPLMVGRPVRLEIPGINVDAPVEYVGLTSDGAMDVPKDPVNVAWFNLGPRPGENGSAVITGHYGWKNKISAVFDNLHTLRKGDKIYIEDEKGTNTVFVVREIQIYGKNEDFSLVFGSSDEKAHLNLITCTGIWNKTKKTYSDRLIVFTDKE